MKAQKANFGKGKIAKFKGKIAILGQILVRWIFDRPKKQKMKGNESPKGQNERNERPKRPK